MHENKSVRVRMGEEYAYVYLSMDEHVSASMGTHENKSVRVRVYEEYAYACVSMDKQVSVSI